MLNAFFEIIIVNIFQENEPFLLADEVAHTLLNDLVDVMWLPVESHSVNPHGVSPLSDPKELFVVDGVADLDVGLAQEHDLLHIIQLLVKHLVFLSLHGLKQLQHVSQKYLVISIKDSEPLMLFMGVYLRDVKEPVEYFQKAFEQVIIQHVV